MSETKNENAQIIDNYDLSFDPGDALNGSLYLCLARDASDTLLKELIQSLREAGLWSNEPHKEVADEQRAAYKDQLQFVAALRYNKDGEEVLIARFDHPKFPSSAERFQLWGSTFDALLTRV